jgi:uncharacterized delta-60 repeat protein
MKKIYLLITLSLTFFATAQNPGDIAQSFGYFPGFNEKVNAITTQADGKILVGGDFTTYKRVTENRIIRLNANGSKDTSFNTGIGFNGTVGEITTQADGKILVGGGFTAYNGVTENRIIRLNADGSKDNSFNTGTGFNFGVGEITTQADGKILVGGEFTTYNGVTENRIIRLNADGSKDTSFNTGSGFNGLIYEITTQADEKILVGGNFLTYNGVTENRIIRLNADGSKDTSFNTGTGFDGTGVDAITRQADGKILVGGVFTTYNGGPENHIIRLNANGSKDTSFNTGTGFNFGVGEITTQADGKILVGGVFTTYNGVTEKHIIRLNANGSKDTSFNTGTGFSSWVNAITTQADGKILVGGSFNGYNGGPENRIIRLNTDGSKDTSFNTGTGFNFGVGEITTQADGKILVGGSFTAYNRVTENRIIRLNADGSKDTSFNTGIGFNDSVYAITTQADGKILVGGLFFTYNGVTENRIIRLNADGSKDTSFNTGTGFNDSVYVITTQADGKILVGGEFTAYKGVTENRIIRLNADGSKDSSFNTGIGFNSGIREITTQADGKILVGGVFTAYNGVTENRIIRLNADGSKDNSFNTGNGFNAFVWKILTHTDGKILMGGGFNDYNGVTENRIIRLNADGSKDNSFNTTGTGLNGQVYAIATQADGKILVGGGFTAYNGGTENRIIRLNADGSKDTSFNTGTGFNDLIYEITTQADGKILVGGNFLTYKGDYSSVFLIGLHSETVLATPSYAYTNELIMYPNPVSNVFHLQTTNFTSLKAVKIFDLQGKLVLEDTNETINVSNLTNGLYLVKVSTEEGEFTKKFIKK